VPSLSRSQLLVYGAIAVALLLLGARWIRSAEAEGAPEGGVERAGEQGGGAGGIEFDSGGEDLVVHVAGAVRDPGVYRLPAGSRVTDAVHRAGGATGEASLDTVNLAAELADGQQVILPLDAGAGGAATAAAGGAGASAAAGPISLGSATIEQLDTIEGIGPVTAQNILDFRTENGGISSVEDLDEISGIGPATMEALRSAVQP
jgi:competence protein ComEA